MNRIIRTKGPKASTIETRRRHCARYMQHTETPRSGLTADARAVSAMEPSSEEASIETAKAVVARTSDSSWIGFNQSTHHTRNPPMICRISSHSPTAAQPQSVASATRRSLNGGAAAAQPSASRGDGITVMTTARARWKPATHTNLKRGARRMYSRRRGRGARARGCSSSTSRSNSRRSRSRERSRS